MDSNYDITKSAAKMRPLFQLALSGLASGPKLSVLYDRCPPVPINTVSITSQWCVKVQAAVRPNSHYQVWSVGL